MNKVKLHWQIIIAMILGVILGYIFNKNDYYLNEWDYPKYKVLYEFVSMLGQIFYNLLKMISIPLIFLSIIKGVASLGRKKNIGKLSFKTMAYYMSTSLIAILIGLAVTNIIKPGIKAPPLTNQQLEQYAQSSIEKVSKAQSNSFSLQDLIFDLTPTNVFKAFTDGNILGIIFIAFIVGIAMNYIKRDLSDILRGVVESLYEVVLKITQKIIMLAPFGVFGLITKSVSDYGLELFVSLGWYVATLVISLGTHFLIVVPLIIFFLIRVNPLKHYKAMSEAMLTAFSTSSSSATLPVTMKCVQENVKVSSKVSNFVLPIGATVNMDGTALYECVGVLFIAQTISVAFPGFDLTFMHQLAIIFTSLLVSVGAAGIPSAGTIMLFIVADAAGLNTPEYKDHVKTFIIAMLAIDRPLDMFRTMVNITSDSVGSAVIAKSEGEKLY